VWIPKESTRVISTNTSLNPSAVRSIRGSYQGPATPLDDLDGDHVLLDYMDGSIHKPIIVGAYPHAQTKRIIVEGIGHTEGAGNNEARGTIYRREAYFRHAGTEARVNGNGDVLIDTVGATDDRVEQDPEAGNSSGHIRVRVKGDRRFTIEMDGEDVLEVWLDGDQVRIDLGEGAGERLVLGDAFRDWLNDWLSNVFESHQHEAGTLVSSGPVTGQTGGVAVTALPPVIPPVQYLGNEMSEDVLSDLARTKKS
jgi:hypothetical protein